MNTDPHQWPATSAASLLEQLAATRETDQAARMARLMPTTGLPAGAACADCGAGTGAACAVECPTRAALDHAALTDDLADTPQPCCPSPVYAAATLCGCQGVPS